jgi:hypothetical protein
MTKQLPRIPDFATLLSLASFWFGQLARLPIRDEPGVKALPTLDWERRSAARGNKRTRTLCVESTSDSSVHFNQGRGGGVQLEQGQGGGVQLERGRGGSVRLEQGRGGSLQLGTNQGFSRQLLERTDPRLAMAVSD